jgi:hypothetical protein
MRVPTVRVTLLAMSPDSSVHVVVDLERCAETISGQITVAGAETTAFFGWLELIDRLERAVEDHGNQAPQAQSSA